MTRNGKIARLPREIRDELNGRLENGEPGVRLAEWLNGLPEVQKALQAHFGGRAISEQNLSEWKSGGYRDWLARQEALSQARELSADAKELADATDGRLTDHLATVLAARYAAALTGWNGEVTEEFGRKLHALRSLCQDIIELRRGDHSGARLNIERERLEREREKTEEEVAEEFERWVNNPKIRDCICQNWKTPEERVRRIRDLLGIAPATPEEAAEQERLREEDTERRVHEILGIDPGNSDEAAPGSPESGSIKPNQTKSNQIDDRPRLDGQCDKTVGDSNDEQMRQSIQ